MPRAARLSAALAYLPVVGWVYVLVFQHENSLAHYHLKQSIGLVLCLALVTAGWIVIGWILAWIPYFFVFGIALFGLVLAAYIFGIVAWLLGISNALRAQLMPLPVCGAWASRLPIR